MESKDKSKSTTHTVGRVLTIIVDILSLFTVGAVIRVSIFALGIKPCISASIII